MKPEVFLKKKLKTSLPPAFYELLLECMEEYAIEQVSAATKERGRGIELKKAKERIQKQEEQICLLERQLNEYNLEEKKLAYGKLKKAFCALMKSQAPKISGNHRLAYIQKWEQLAGI